jgi:hypothetical protein
MLSSVRRIAAGILLALVLAVPADAAGKDIALSLFRAVRISDTSITLSFVTDRSSIATLVYAGSSDERTVTLTDTVPQIDHLFTIDDLNPSAAYSFTITADAGGNTSDKYVVLLSPETIGPLGQSIIPSVQEINSQGKVVSSVIAASTTPDVPSQGPLAAGIALVAIGYGLWRAYSFMKQRSHRQSP